MKESMAGHRKNMGTTSDHPQAIQLVRQKDLNGLRALLRAQPDEANVQDAITGMTALHVAAAANLPEFVTELLAVCDPTLLDLDGRSAATVAELNHQNEELIDRLSEATSLALENEEKGSASRVSILRPKEP